MTENLKRMFFALDRAMLEAHREDRDKDAEDTARVLLGYPELPLLIRSRACKLRNTERHFISLRISTMLTP